MTSFEWIIVAELAVLIWFAMDTFYRLGGIGRGVEAYITAIHANLNRIRVRLVRNADDLDDSVPEDVGTLFDEDRLGDLAAMHADLRCIRQSLAHETHVGADWPKAGEGVQAQLSAIQRELRVIRESLANVGGSEVPRDE